LSAERVEWLNEQVDPEAEAHIRTDSETLKADHDVSFAPNELRWMDERGTVSWAALERVESIRFKSRTPRDQGVAMGVGGGLGVLGGALVGVWLGAKLGEPPPCSGPVFCAPQVNQGGEVAGAFIGGALGLALGAGVGAGLARLFGDTTQQTVDFVPRRKLGTP
jgi:hypothetical protein